MKKETKTHKHQPIEQESANQENTKSFQESKERLREGEGGPVVRALIIAARRPRKSRKTSSGVRGLNPPPAPSMSFSRKEQANIPCELFNGDDEEEEEEGFLPTNPEDPSKEREIKKREKLGLGFRSERGGVQIPARKWGSVEMEERKRAN